MALLPYKVTIPGFNIRGTLTKSFYRESREPLVEKSWSKQFFTKKTVSEKNW